MPTEAHQWQSHRATSSTPTQAASNGSSNTSINPDVLPRDVGGGIGCEECDRCGNLFGFAVSLQRNACSEFLFLRKAVDETREHIVHADVVHRIFVRI